ncbi:MAG: hypothetical protein ACP5RH_06180 [Leptodesmis sp.]|uniref:hypothetical protein n=1 Tax=Leptodesmis sp. TaxID=3100501 RepID=UPI003D12B574
MQFLRGLLGVAMPGISPFMRVKRSRLMGLGRFLRYPAVLLHRDNYFHFDFAKYLGYPHLQLETEAI